MARRRAFVEGGDSIPLSTTRIGRLRDFRGRQLAAPRGRSWWTRHALDLEAARLSAGPPSRRHLRAWVLGRLAPDLAVTGRHRATPPVLATTPEERDGESTADPESTWGAGRVPPRGSSGCSVPLPASVPTFASAAGRGRPQPAAHGLEVALTKLGGACPISASSARRLPRAYLTGARSAVKGTDCSFALASPLREPPWDR